MPLLKTISFVPIKQHTIRPYTLYPPVFLLPVSFQAALPCTASLTVSPSFLCFRP